MQHLKKITVLSIFAVVLLIGCSDVNMSAEEKKRVTEMDSAKITVEQHTKELEEQTRKVEESLEKLDEEFNDTIITTKNN